MLCRRFSGPTGASNMVVGRAMSILEQLHGAEEELVGKAVIMTNGIAGTVNHIYLDEIHGIRISLQGHDGRWPISTVKAIES